MKNKIISSYGVIFLFILSFCFVLAVFISTTSLMESNMKTMEYNIEQRLMYIAEQLSRFVTAEELEQYREAGDMELESYQSLRHKLFDFSERTDILYAYYIRPEENGLLQYIIDNDFNEETRVGLDTEPYHIDTVPFMRQVFDGKIVSAGRGIYTPNWEGLLSIYAPVYNREGKVTAIAGVDIDDAAIMNVWRITRILTVVQIIMVIAVFLSGIIAIIRLRKTAQIAENANRSKGDFLASMSHEIRTPMNAITGMAELVLRSDLPADIRCYVQDIKHAGSNLISIINDILDISKIEAGKLEIVPVNYTLFSLVNDTINITRARLKDKLIWFNADINKNIPGILIGDEVRLRQIILNLLSNAVKYTERGGINFSIEIEKMDDIATAAALVPADSGTSLGKVWLKITVSDTGRGIKPEDQAKLFSNFVQVDKKKNVGIEGTGLGLAITKRLVDAMGGSISLQSIYGEGSTFTVLVPQDVSSPEPFGDMEFSRQDYNETLPAAKNIFVGARILVVDDLDVNLKVAEGLLAPYHAAVDICLNGETAIKLANQNKYDIIFMDHMMPEMDGIETTKKIREFNKNVPIIALTANAIVGMKEKFIENGFNDFLSKPIDIIKLDEMLNRWIENKNERANLRHETGGGEKTAEYNEEFKKSENSIKEEIHNLPVKKIGKIKHKSGLRAKLTAACLILALVLTAAVTWVSYYSYRSSMIEKYTENIRSIAATAAALIDPESAERYLSTLEKDEEYERLYEQFRIIQKKNNLEFLYAYVPSFDHLTVLVQGTSPGDEGHFDLGAKVGSEYYTPEELVFENRVFSDPEAERILIGTTVFGFLISAFEVVYNAEGQPVLQVGADMSMDKINAALGEYLLRTCAIAGLIIAVFVFLYLIYLRRYVTNPMEIALRKAQASNKAKSDFLAKAGRSLRAPLNVITGTNELILKGGSPEKICDYANDIKQAAANLAFFINGILDFSENDAETQEENELNNKIKQNSQSETNSALSIYGVDIKRGIANIGGKAEKYTQILSTFCNNILERMPLIQTMPSADTLPVFITQIHALKSSLATIGAQDLSAFAADIEKAGNDRNFDFIQGKLPSFVKQLSELIKNITEAIGPKI